MAVCSDTKPEAVYPARSTPVSGLTAPGSHPRYRGVRRREIATNDAGPRREGTDENRPHAKGVRPDA